MEHYTIFDSNGFRDYKSWLSNDKSKYRTIHKLLLSIQRDGPLKGYGKPEILKENYKGCYSRRIDEKNRLIYKYSEENGNTKIFILGCSGHYEKKENTEKYILLDMLD